MITTQTDINSYYDREVVERIYEKYGIDRMSALAKFTQSKTYAMLCDPQLCMTEFSPAALFDMWECEQVTGNPTDSLYISRDERV